MIKRLICLLIFASLLLAGCESGLIDKSHDLRTQKIGELPTSKFFDFAWVSETTFIIVDHNFFDSKMWLMNIKTNEITHIQIEPACKYRHSIRGLQRLPNQKIGFSLNCYSETIQEVNLDTNSTRIVYAVPIITYLGHFTYSANMKELILEDVKGVHLESSLYHVGPDGERKNITPDFIRAYFPDWSSKNNLVVFFGTKPYPGSDVEIQHFSQTEKLLDHPWQIYLWDPGDSTTSEIPIEVVGPNGLKWSPDGRMLAFSGEYKGVLGVWLVSNLDNPDNLIITRVIDNLAKFDFSPDGTSIAYAYGGVLGQKGQNVLYIVDLTNLIEKP